MSLKIFQISSSVGCLLNATLICILRKLHAVSPRLTAEFASTLLSCELSGVLTADRLSPRNTLSSTNALTASNAPN
jgi:hypothetical protein